MSRRKWLGLGAGVLILAMAGYGTLTIGHAGTSDKGIPTTRVQRGTVEINVYARGHLRPERSAVVSAPPVSGALQIIRMAPAGTIVKTGDVVLEFDPSEQEYNLEQNQSKLAEAEQQIIKTRADSAVQAAQDKVALLKARFDVRRAELEVQKNELVSEIDAKKNKLALDEAKRRLTQLEQDVRSRQESNSASVAVLEQQRNQARLSMAQAQHSIDVMTIKSPIGGVVTIKGNEDALGGFRYQGMTVPDYKAGDQVYPGRPVMEVLDVEHMEVVAKIAEDDRGNVTAGQTAAIAVDASPKTTYTGKLKAIAGLASRQGFWDAGGPRTFDANFAFERPDASLRPGAGAQVIVQGTSLADKLFVPRQCIFEKNGKRVIYVRQGSSFEPREVKIVSQSESRAVIDGLAEGTEIALLDPTAKSNGSKSAEKSSAPTVAGK
jgi:HlyD family secretion protein